VLACEIEHLVLVEKVALLAELVAQVAEQGGGVPTQSLSATEVADIPQSRLIQVTSVALPSAR
jgi:hypothetical protein